jgi:hypothetical protein
MEFSAERAITLYAQAYQRLYNRLPADMRALDNEWVVVNGARMQVNELEYLTRQLQREYDQGMAQRRTVLSKLISWFKQ